MTLKEARITFSTLLATKLIPLLISLGYEVAFDEVTQHQGKGHREGSLHYQGCAGDLILYQGGLYITDTESYRTGGEYWESLHPFCRWGGRWGDGNHFSFSPPELFGQRA